MTVIRRAHGRPTRVLAVLALTAPLAGALVLSAAGPAFASSVSWVSPTPAGGEVFSSGTSVQLKARITVSARESSSASIKLVPPSGSAYNYGPWSCTGGTFGGASCDSAMSAVSLNGASRSNGTWTATLNGGSPRVFYSNFPPTADPANLAAAPVGRTEVDLSWSYSGTEPDKAGFEIVETHNGTSRTIGPVGSCSGSTCGYALTYDQPATGTTETYSYTVTALRQSGGCSSCGTYTRSSASSSASAQLVGPPPPPSPTPTPSPTGGTSGGTTSGGTTTGTSSGGTTGTTGGSSGGSTGGSTTGTSGGSTSGTSTTGSTTGSGGSTTGHSAGKPIAVPTLPPIVASRKAFALGFNKFSPALGIPKLPPLPAVTSPAVGAGSDTYAPTLPYKGGTGTKKTTSVLSSPVATFQNLNTTQLANLAAIALLLLVCAAHVRLFLARTDED